MQKDTTAVGGRRGYTKLPDSIVAAGRQLNDAEFRCYAVIKSFDWKGQGCWPGQERLAEMMGCSTDKVQRALAGLVAKGLLERRRRGQGLTNTYLLSASALTDPASQQHPEAAPVRFQEAVSVRLKEDEVEVDEVETTSLSTLPVRRASAPHGPYDREARIAVVTELATHVLPYLEDDDDNTVVTWAQIALAAKQPIDPGLAHYIATKIEWSPLREASEVGRYRNTIPASAAYVTGILKNFALAPQYCSLPDAVWPQSSYGLDDPEERHEYFHAMYLERGGETR